MRNTVLPLGTRCRLSTLGKERCPSWREKSGVVVGRLSGRARLVKLNGLKVPVAIHLSYLDAVEDELIAAQNQNADLEER